MSIPIDLLFEQKPHVRNFSPAILGLEMAAPILWAPGIFRFFLLENPFMPIKFLALGGLVFVWRRRGGSANFIFTGARIFLTLGPAKTYTPR